MKCWLQLNAFFSRLQMVSLLMLSFQDIQLCLRHYHPWIIASNRKYNYGDTRTFEYLKLRTVLRTEATKSCWDLQHWVVTSLSQITQDFVLKSSSGSPYMAIFQMKSNTKTPTHLSCLKYVCDKLVTVIWDPMKNLFPSDHESWSLHWNHDPVSSSSLNTINVSFFRIQWGEINTNIGQGVKILKTFKPH